MGFERFLPVLQGPLKGRSLLFVTGLFAILKLLREEFRAWGSGLGI